MVLIFHLGPAGVVKYIYIFYLCNWRFLSLFGGTGDETWCFVRSKYSAFCLYPYTKDTASPKKGFLFVALVILELALKSMLALNSVLLVSASQVLELKGVDHHHLAQ